MPPLTVEAETTKIKTVSLQFNVQTEDEADKD